MMIDAGRSEEEAIGWVIRLREPAFADWDAFTAWLERDPGNLAAYEEAALADEDAAKILEKPKPAMAPKPAFAPHVERRPARRGIGRRLALGSAVAASLIAVFGLSTLQSGTRIIETEPGQHRTVTLAGGSRIDLNGATRIRLDEDNPRFASLEQGEALFTVVHDASRPFKVEAGEATLLDVGTVFNVTRQEQGMRVAVSEGAVVYNPGREKLRLAAGKALDVSAGAAPQVEDVALDEVAGWREGRLVYSGAPLSVVAADLTRNLGQSVQVTGNASRPFSGVIILDRKDDQFVATLGPLLGGTVSRSGSGWTIAIR